MVNPVPAARRKAIVVTVGRVRSAGAFASALEARGRIVVLIDHAAIPPRAPRRQARRRMHDRVVHLRAGFAREPQTRRAARTVRDRDQRDERIDAAVLAAGAFVHGPLRSHSAGDQQRMVRDHVLTALRSLHELARAMPGGRVGVMASLVDHRAVRGNPPDAASNAAPRMRAEVIREEMRGAPIRIGHLCPGAVAGTTASPIPRRGHDPVDPANATGAVRWLLDRPPRPRFDERRLVASVGVTP